MKEEKKKQPCPRPCVGVFIFNDKEELFMIKAPRWNDKYIVPGGGIKVGETMIDAAKREVKEETNMKIDEINLISTTEGVNLKDKYNGKNNHLIFLNFKAKAKNTDNIKLNDEGIKYKWKKPSEWIKGKNVGENTRQVIEEQLLDENSYEDKYKRALADYQNLLKRTAKEKDEFAKYANEGILHEIIPVYDNLKTAIIHSNNSDEDKDSDPWLEGVKYVVKQFKDVLESVGVEEIKTVGEKFDHNTMEAIEGKGEKVKSEVRPGYRLKDKVIIPAKVVLG